MDITRLLPAGMAAKGNDGMVQSGAQALPSGDVAADGVTAKPGEAAAEAARRAGLPDLSGPVDMEQLGEIMAESSRLVKENPQQAALLIRYWLNEGRLQQ